MLIFFPFNIVCFPLRYLKWQKVPLHTTLSSSASSGRLVEGQRKPPSRISSCQQETSPSPRSGYAFGEREGPGSMDLCKGKRKFPVTIAQFSKPVNKFLKNIDLDISGPSHYFHCNSMTLEVETMFVFGNMLQAAAYIIDTVLTIYMWVIIARALISWVNPDPYNRIVVFLYRVTEPVLRPVRRLIPLGHLGIDISPIIVILVIYFLKIFLVQTLIQTAYHFKS
jgi:YggT family protein